MNKPLHFHCDFGDGITVTIDFDVAEHLRSKQVARVQRIEWTGKPTEQTIAPYLEWMHTVNAQIAKAINGKYLYVAQRSANPKDWEKWIYYPDGRKERGN